MRKTLCTRPRPFVLLMYCHGYLADPPDLPENVTCVQKGQFGEVMCTWRRGRETHLTTTSVLWWVWKRKRKGQTVLCHVPYHSLIGIWAEESQGWWSLSHVGAEQPWWSSIPLLPTTQYGFYGKTTTGLSNVLLSIVLLSIVFSPYRLKYGE